MPRLGPSSTVASEKVVITAARIVTFTLVCAILYWGRAIFVPVALATLLSFILSPLVHRLELCRLPRVTAVVVVALFATAAIGGLLYVVTLQLSDFADGLPEKRAIIKEKLADIRGVGRGGAIEEIQHTLEAVSEEIDQEELNGADVGEVGAPSSVPEPTRPRVGINPITNYAPADRAPVAVTIVPKSKVLEWESVKALAPVFASVGQIGLVAILVVLLLIAEEDLRGRIVSIAGDARLAVTTQALHNAGTRISNYLSIQLALNAAYGVAVGLGLYLIGVPYVFLWGVCAALFRYIPYVGPWVAALLPLTTTLISSPGWETVGFVLLLFIALELVSNNAIEPWLYGRSVGIPAFILLISAIFWAWLWGPVGLVLSTPLTVCLVALGEHVEPLHFLARLLGSESQLAPHLLLYQRLLASDAEGVAALIEQQRSSENGDEPSSEVDLLARDVIAPVLTLIKRDTLLESLPESEQQRILNFLEERIEELASAHAPRPLGGADSRILLCPATDRTDETAAHLLALVLRTGGASCSVLSHRLLASEVNQITTEQDTRILAIISVGPGGISPALRICKRLAACSTTAEVMVNHWGELSGADRQALEGAGAQKVATGIWGGRDLLAPMDQFYKSQGLADSIQGQAKRKPCQ